MNSLKAQWQHMAEVEMMERYYGVDTSTPDYGNIDRDIDYVDNIREYRGYEADDYDGYIDSDWPAIDDCRYRSQFDEFTF